MECSNCTATVPDDDAFCEECGKPLADEGASARCTCGALVEDADEEGFCGMCGRRVRPRESDHIEAELSPLLAAVSDKGHRHDRNEDRFAIRRFDARVALAVCDGVSTSTESELASSLAADTFVEAIGNGIALCDAMRQAANAVAALAPRDGNASSTTAVGAVVAGGSIEVAWTGDSRAYWIDADGATPLTSDHSWLNEVVIAGQMTEHEANRDRRAHAITRWFGADAGEDAACDARTFEIPGPGALLLCSDGLWNYAPQPADIAQLYANLPASVNALERCRALVEYANEQGGQDNITVALLQIESQD